MSSRRQFLVLASSLLGPATSIAQLARIPKIGLLWIRPEGEDNRYVSAFREGLRAQGYIEGKNIQLIESSLVDKYPLFPQAAARLVAEPVDVIITYGRSAATAAAKATSTIPIVAMMSTDPVAAGFAISLARPGKNMTGVMSIGIEVGQKRLEFLTQLIPQLQTVGVPFNSESAGELIGIKTLDSAARSLKLDMRLIAVRQINDLSGALETATRTGVQAFAPAPSTMFSTNAQSVVDVVRRTRLPAIYFDEEFVRAGGLMSYGASQTAIFRRSAFFVDKILKGAKPAELPMEQPTAFELVVNLRAAKDIRLDIPQSLLLRADRIIE
jgi:putative ABC transport system substrate-binding protein